MLSHKLLGFLAGNVQLAWNTLSFFGCISRINRRSETQHDVV